MIAIIDYEMGNLKSVANAFKAVGVEPCITRDPSELSAADRIVLPGVGAFGNGMERLRRLGFVRALEENVREKKKPFLGICLGMQLLATKGFEFGEHAGLGWIEGEVRRLESPDLPVPHVGWNDVAVTQSSPLLEGIGDKADFYFVHSYHFEAAQPDSVTATCEYGQRFAASVSHGNIFGVQFHPEKSQKAGKHLLENFLRISA
ncbi:MAG: imidazole glycerol phosphate synthase subunit HisH [Candidatus Omnitrophota bacterium]|nr:imidazole glycerol phosphate synthase subunit HisH [Candidatus Omnitrophota bacterium]